MANDAGGIGDRRGGTSRGGRATSELVELATDECRALLASEEVGRLGVGRPQGTPLIVPVNYVVSDGAILFRTGFGTKLPALVGRPVSFQVDRFDHAARTGWCVLVTGRAEEISTRAGCDPLPDPWVADDKPYLIRISIRSLSGRRIVGPQAAEP
jgi:hypothetical protein